MDARGESGATPSSAGSATAGSGAGTLAADLGADAAAAGALFEGAASARCSMNASDATRSAKHTRHARVDRNQCHTWPLSNSSFDQLSNEELSIFLMPAVLSIRSA